MSSISIPFGHPCANIKFPSASTASTSSTTTTTPSFDSTSTVSSSSPSPFVAVAAASHLHTIPCNHNRASMPAVDCSHWAVNTSPMAFARWRQMGSSEVGSIGESVGSSNCSQSQMLASSSAETASACCERHNCSRTTQNTGKIQHNRQQHQFAEELQQKLSKLAMEKQQRQPPKQQQHQHKRLSSWDGDDEEQIPPEQMCEWMRMCRPTVTAAEERIAIVPPTRYEHHQMHRDGIGTTNPAHSCQMLQANNGYYRQRHGTHNNKNNNSDGSSQSCNSSSGFGSSESTSAEKAPADGCCCCQTQMNGQNGTNNNV